MSSRINHLAVFVSAIVFFLLSWVWYTYAFGAAYMAQIQAMTGKPPAEPANMAIPLVVTFVLGWILAYVIAIALSMPSDAKPAGRGFGFGLFIGAGVYATMTYMGVVWSQLTPALWAINAAFVIVAMAIMGWLIGAWSARTETAAAA